MPVCRHSRQRVAERIARARQRDVSADQIVITTGAIGALYSALMSVIDPGDEVLIPDPGWPNYEAIVRLADATPVRFAQTAARGFLPDPGEIARLVTPELRRFSSTRRAILQERYSPPR